MFLGVPRVRSTSHMQCMNWADKHSPFASMLHMSGSQNNWPGKVLEESRPFLSWYLGTNDTWQVRRRILANFPSWGLIWRATHRDTTLPCHISIATDRQPSLLLTS